MLRRPSVLPSHQPLPCPNSKWISAQRGAGRVSLLKTSAGLWPSVPSSVESWPRASVERARIAVLSSSAARKLEGLNSRRCWRRCFSRYLKTQTPTATTTTTATTKTSGVAAAADGMPLPLPLPASGSWSPFPKHWSPSAPRCLFPRVEMSTKKWWHSSFLRRSPKELPYFGWSLLWTLRSASAFSRRTCWKGRKSTLTTKGRGIWEKFCPMTKWPKLWRSNGITTRLQPPSIQRTSGHDFRKRWWLHGNAREPSSRLGAC
mmetsp:Transcript_85690/g.179033  ORF Transcript_85690/g.179033 Transcript_85690/m.179033 type:complete len:261 (+) Transcript_85690:1185-1967(+)